MSLVILIRSITGVLMANDVEGMWGQVNSLSIADNKVKAVEYEAVENVRVIHLRKASYRGIVVQGTFKLRGKAASDDLTPSKNGTLVKVVTDWHSHKPKAGWRKFLAQEADYKIEEGYHGKVVRNIVT